jgi:hypothetical protein
MWYAASVPTILRIGNLRVVIYGNDHRPAHVHIAGAENKAIFYLNCPIGPVSLRENNGFTHRQLNRVADALNRHMAELCTAWKDVHGYY